MDLKARSGGVLYRRAAGEDFNEFGRDFILPKPADVPFAFSTVVKPNGTINFSVDVAANLEDPVNLNSNFRDSRLDWTFAATPVPGPSPLLLLGVGLVGLVLVRRRSR